jgi:N-acetyl sugar amidotransferase
MKSLVLLTTQFPDPILDHEVPFLANAFDHVYILPEIPGGDSPLPNVTVRNIFQPVDLRSPRTLLIKHFSGLMRPFLYSLRFANKTNYLRYYRSFVGHYLNEAAKIEPLRQFIRSNNLSDAIFYDYWMVDATLALAALKQEGFIKHTLSRVHGFDLYDDRQFEGCVSFREYRVNSLEAVFAISEHGLNYIREKLPRRLHHKIRLSYLGVNDRGCGPSLKTDRTTGYTVVSCARLIPLKRISLLAQALSMSRLPVRWVHFGDGPMHTEVSRLIANLPDHIVADFRGDVRNEAVIQYYQDTYVDLFVSVSESEGLPVSMMEAISFGIPILACSIAGIPELVNEITGRLMPVNASSVEIASHVDNALLHGNFNRPAIRRFYETNYHAATNYNNFVREIHDIFKLPLMRQMYRQCNQCLLDTEDDPAIAFDEHGICQYCRQYKLDERKLVVTGEAGERALAAIVDTIKESGKGRKYDCIIGISGGVDSTYLAYKASQLGLRLLAVHFDNGWNSELAVKNIENIVSKLGMDLYTLVVDWNEFRDLQVAFLKASVIDIELVTDHAMLATLYRLALKKNVKYILSGHNVVTEAVLPKNWYHDKRDHIHLKSINKLFGNKPLKTMPFMSSWLKFRVSLSEIESVCLLNYLPYNKSDIKEFLVHELGWRDYGGKHYESIFTRFYQGYILPRKFGTDKRKAHLSNLICSGQISREMALKELAQPPYDPQLQKEDYEFVIKKLKLSPEEFETIMSMPPKKHADYPVDSSIYQRFQILKYLAPFWRTYKGTRERFSKKRPV